VTQAERKKSGKVEEGKWRSGIGTEFRGLGWQSGQYERRSEMRGTRTRTRKDKQKITRMSLKGWKTARSCTSAKSSTTRAEIAARKSEKEVTSDKIKGKTREEMGIIFRQIRMRRRRKRREANLVTHLDECENPFRA
jgi:hypothetical protein